MYKDIKQFFKKNASHLVPSNKLTKQLKTFRLTWSTKSDEYIDFLGSNLLGVYNIKFSKIDDDLLMESTLRISNYEKLQKEIFKVKGIEKNFNIGSNIIYQTLLYLIYKYITSKDLNKEEREAGIYESCLIMQYRMFTSLHSHYFVKYNIPEYIASDVYNKLSNKFLIKKLDSWQEVFKYRTNLCLEKNTPINSKFRTLTTKDSLDALANIQTNIREQIKSIYSVLLDVLEKDDILMQDKATFIGGDDHREQLKDADINVYKTINQMKAIAVNSNDFIDRDSMLIVLSLFNKTKFDEFYAILNNMSNIEEVKIEDIENIVEQIILISYTYLNRIGINIGQRENIPKALTAIKFYWSSSKVKNDALIQVKEDVKKHILMGIKIKTKWLISSYVLAYITYVFLRSVK